MALAIQHTRANVRLASGVDLVAGLWMIVAPFLLAYSAISVAMWNSVIFGIGIALLAARRETDEGYRHAWPSWVNVIIGLWLIAAPFAFGFDSIAVAMWNHVVTGAIVVAFAMWSALATPKEM